MRQSNSEPNAKGKTVHLEEEVWIAFKLYAVTKRTTVTAAINRAAKEFLARNVKPVDGPPKRAQNGKVRRDG